MKFKALALIALQTVASLAATNEPCYGPNKSPGVCVSTSACKRDGGTSYKGACPGSSYGSAPDPGNIQCCVKPSCKGGGACLWQSDCDGKPTSNQCPGPSAFKCCPKPKSVFGTYKTPELKAGGCKAVAQKGAKTVMKAFPGRVRDLGCYRVDPGSDHNDGKAIDFMISDHFVDATIGGREIAEWVMNHRKELKLSHVIYGQRIWSIKNRKGVPDKVGGWPGWRTLEDRGSINENHWNHVHVSFL